MTRSQLREVLLRVPGSQAEVARELGITKQTVNIWLAGRMNSQRIDTQVRQRAARILADEKRTEKLAS